MHVPAYRGCCFHAVAVVALWAQQKVLEELVMLGQGCTRSWVYTHKHIKQVLKVNRGCGRAPHARKPG